MSIKCAFTILLKPKDCSINPFAGITPIELDLLENQRQQSSTSNKPHLAEKRISTSCSLAGDFSCPMFTRCLREKLSLSSSSWR